MGRQSTGALKTAGVCRIEMRDLTRLGILKKQYYSFELNWNDGSSICLYLTNNQEGHFLTAAYTLTDRQGETHRMNYRIYLDRIPSNLGRGFVYYFLCPNTGKRCRVLYRAYGSHTFRARTSYPYRLYYPLQAESKRTLVFERLHSAKERLERVTRGRKRKQYYFKGERTKNSLRRERYFDTFCQLDEDAERFFSSNILKGDKSLMR